MLITIPATISGGVDNIVWDETPTGTVNGSNAVFTLTHTPVPAGKLILTVNGLRQNVGPSNDFQISGGIITFNAGTVPQTGDIILVTYSY